MNSGHVIWVHAQASADRERPADYRPSTNLQLMHSERPLTDCRLTDGPADCESIERSADRERMTERSANSRSPYGFADYLTTARPADFRTTIGDLKVTAMVADITVLPADCTVRFVDERLSLGEDGDVIVLSESMALPQPLQPTQLLVTKVSRL